MDCDDINTDDGAYFALYVDSDPILFMRLWKRRNGKRQWRVHWKKLDLGANRSARRTKKHWCQMGFQDEVEWERGNWQTQDSVGGKRL